jgi:2,3-bisphosphoglycerate-dependent phosphoglycerate mutase
LTNLYLIRHGEAINALEGKIGNSGLSPLGMIQAERLRDRLAATKEIKADILISSTLHRAHQTAQIVAPAFDLPIVLDDTIQELRPGEAEGMTIEEYKEAFGKVDFEVDPYHPMAPGGESWADFMLRVGSALHRITHEHAGKTIVLFCHGGVIDGSFLYFFKISSWTIPAAHFFTRNTSITHWQQGKMEDNKKYWQLMKYNDAFHLHDIGSEATIPWRQLLPRPASDTDRPTVPIQTEAERVDDVTTQE